MSWWVVVDAAERAAAGMADASGRACHADAGSIERLELALRWWRLRAGSGGISDAPTSALTGGGAVAELEGAFSAMHAGRPALLLPSASYALYTALRLCGVRPGAEVLIPALDWSASWEAVATLGATPVPIAVDSATATISVDAARQMRTARTSAVVACHLHGVAADVPALRAALPDVRIVEDCAAALGSSLDGSPVGTFGDFAAFSLGPGKTIDAGEGGVLVTAGSAAHLDAVRLTAHPLRQLLAGLDPPTVHAAMSIRPHWVTAILGLHQVVHFGVVEARRRHRDLARALDPEVTVLGLGTRRENAQPGIPVRVGASHADLGAGTGAVVLGQAGTPGYAETEALRRSIRVTL